MIEDGDTLSQLMRSKAYQQKKIYFNNCTTMLPYLFLCLCLFVVSFDRLSHVTTTRAFAPPPTTYLQHRRRSVSHRRRTFANTGAIASSATTDSASPSSSSSKSTSSANNNNSTRLNNSDGINHKNLYEILGARGDESRAELKQKYIALAKLYHPDAAATSTSSSSSSSSGLETTATDFAEIAAAWRILADPKQRQRYDRTLQAEAFSQEVVQWASAMTKQAGPVLEKFAIPLLRRTTATTLASVQAVMDDLNLKPTSSSELDRANRSDNNSSATLLAASTTASSTTKIPARTTKTDLSRTFQAAMAAAKRASEYVDSVELLEQSVALQERAKEKEEALQVLLDDLRRKTKLRLQMALRTPKSGLTANEALLVLQEEFNQTSSTAISNGSVEKSGATTTGGGIWQQLLHSKSIEEEISSLQQLEETFQEIQVEDTAVQADYQFHVEQKAQKQAQLMRAKQAERDAMRALELARQQVANATKDLDEATYTVQQAEQYVKKSSFELERTSHTVDVQSEKVRKALWQKERELLLKLGHKSSSSSTVREALNEEERQARLQQLQELRQQEEIMLESSRILQANTERLRLRAQKLQEKAMQLDRKASTTSTASAPATK